MKIHNNQLSNSTGNNSPAQASFGQALAPAPSFQFTRESPSGIFQNLNRSGSARRANAPITTAAQAATALAQAEGFYNSANLFFTSGNRDAARPLVNQAIDLLNQVGRYNNSASGDRVLPAEQVGKLSDLLMRSLTLRNQIGS